MSIAAKIMAAAALAALAVSSAQAQENYQSWPPLQSTFESTGGNGIMIKGYDPVILQDKCVTTFMAVTPAPDVNVYFNVIEFEATQVQGGTLCANGKWRSMDGSATGTTPFRMFFKDGTFRRAP
jgi:opacity protein-like surface antigen